VDAVGSTIISFSGISSDDRSSDWDNRELGVFCGISVGICMLFVVFVVFCGVDVGIVIEFELSPAIVVPGSLTLIMSFCQTG
jgi:hypothetical protein